jgi:hypothetical protein
MILAALILGVGLGAFIVIGFGVAADAVIDPFITNLVNKFFLRTGRPEALRCRFTKLDAAGKAVFTADMPTEALERGVAALPPHATGVEVEVDGEVMELVPQEEGIGDSANATSCRALVVAGPRR